MGEQEARKEDREEGNSLGTTKGVGEELAEREGVEDVVGWVEMVGREE